MYCQKCGDENPDHSPRCLSCGSELNPDSPPPPTEPKTSSMAIAALVLGILTILCGVTALPAVICGIIALVKISNSRGLLKGNGMAITGIALPVVTIFLMAAILMPALSRVKIMAQRIVCDTNLKGLSMAMIIYANDYNDETPTADKWCDLLIQEADVSPQSFYCPGAPQAKSTYALNKNFHNLRGQNPDRIVAIFECSPGWNQSGGPELLTTEYHQGEGCNVAFADGHVEFVKADKLDELNWGD